MECYCVLNAIGYLDNGNNAKKRQEINQYCMNYLYNLYKDIDRKSLIYDKWGGIYEI